MAIRHFCDGCGIEIKAWDPKDPTSSDGLRRLVKIETGNNTQGWELCDPCQDKTARTLVELLPSTSRDTWWDAIRPAKKS